MENLRESIRRCGIQWNLIVLCMDSQTASYCSQRNIPHVPCPTNVSQEFVNWNTHSKETVNRTHMQKLDCLLYFMHAYPHMKDFIYMDGDIVVFKDFVPYVKFLGQNYDMVFQCDEKNSEPDCSRTLPGKVCANACTGFMYIRNTAMLRSALNYHAQLPEGYASRVQDQEYVNWILKSHPTLRVRWTTFPRDTIPNGSFRDSFTASAYLLHYNFLTGSEKQEEMKKRGHWIV